MTMLDTALAYAAHGWPVFPLRPRDKKPLGRLAPHGFQDATTDAEKIRRWWSAQPNANIGMPTGEAFDVADLDSSDVMTRFQVLAKEHGVNLSEWPRSRTGRGRHVLFKPTGLGNRVNVIEGMDWRGDGGYIVMPGSVHASGATYEWLIEPGDLPEAPAWLLELVRVAKKEGEKHPASPVETPPSKPPEGPHDRYVTKGVEEELSAARAATEGARNHTLNKAAFALGQMVGAGWIQRGYAEHELLAAAHACGLVAEDGEKACRATIRSGLESGEQKPRETPQERPPTVTRQTQAPTVRRPEPQGYTAAELERMEIAPLKEIVPGLLPIGLTMLAGKPKLGKSWLVLDLALRVSLGDKVLGSVPVPRRSVLYLALEDNKRRMKQRLHQVYDAGWPENLTVYHDWETADRGGVDRIIKWCEETPDGGLVIIDVWKRIRPARQRGAQIYDEDYEHLMPLQQLAQRREIAVLLVHHTRKGAAEDVQDEISGTLGIAAALDATMVLHRTRSEADGELFITGRDVEEQHLALKFDGGQWQLIGPASAVTKSKERREILEILNGNPVNDFEHSDSNSQESVNAVNARGMSPVEVAEALGKPRNQVKQLLWKMLTDGEIRRVTVNAGGHTNTKYVAAVTAFTGSDPIEMQTAFTDNRVYRLPAEEGAVNGKRSLSRPPAPASARAYAREEPTLDGPTCPTCGSSTRTRPMIGKGPKPWCDTCEDWAS